MSSPASGHVDLAAGRYRLASMRSRLGARIVDAVIVGTPLVIVDAMLLAASLDDGMYGDRTDPGIGTWALVIGLGVVACAAYEAGLTAAQGATIGKRVVGIRVARADRPGEPDDGVGVATALTRCATLVVPGLVCAPWGVLCSASPYLDSAGRRGWHDRAAKTYVLTVGR